MREKKDINIQIGNEIRIAREKTGLTQSQFGELMQLGTKNVSDIERGVAGIKISTLKRICEKLSISSDTILFGDKIENNVDFYAERLKRLSPEQFQIVAELLDKLIEVYGLLDNDINKPNGNLSQ